MAAGSSNQNGASGIGVVDFSLLPEGCVASALSFTNPRDVCRLSLVASTFRSAAESDAVWERFLPSDYQDVIARSVDESPITAFASKKELYLHLCDHPIIIDGGTKSFSLDKASGKKCYMIAARDLSIVWGDTPRYWRWIPLPESRFAEVAELVSVCWLEVIGKIDISMLSRDTTYAAYLVFKQTEGTSGFDYQPAEVCVVISGVETEMRTVYLDPEGRQRHRSQLIPRRTGFFNNRTASVFRQEARQEAPVPREGDGQYPNRRGDGWLEIELGEYENYGGEDGELNMCLMEVKGGNWKSGLIVQGIEIRPKDVK